MKWSRFIISIGQIFLTATTISAQDSTDMKVLDSETYRHHVEWRQRRWASLIPNQFVAQNAGNMGMLSAGVGWGYAHGHWETHLLWGYIPKHQSTRGKPGRRDQYRR